MCLWMNVFCHGPSQRSYNYVERIDKQTRKKSKSPLRKTIHKTLKDLPKQKKKKKKNKNKGQTPEMNFVSGE